MEGKRKGNRMSVLIKQNPHVKELVKRLGLIYLRTSENPQTTTPAQNNP